MEIVGNYDNAFQIMSSDKCSQLVLLSKRQHIRLAPKYMGNIRFGITCHMSCALGRFSKQLEGAPIAYKNTKITQRLGKIIGEQTCIHFDVDADFIVFKPTVGSILKGQINKVTKEHLGCVVHGCFNAWMLHTCATQKVAIDTLMGSEVEFQVESINTNFGVMSLKGKLTKLLSQPCGLYGLDIKLEPENKKSKKKQKTKNNATAADDASAVPSKKKNKSKTSSTNVVPQTENETSMSESNYANETVLAGDVCDLQSSILLDSSVLEPVISSTQVEHSATSKKKKKKKHKKNETDEIITDISALDSLNASEESLRENGVHDSSSPRKKKKKKHKKSDVDDAASSGTLCVEDVHANGNDCDSGISSDRTKRKRKLNQEQTIENIHIPEEIVLKKKHKKNKSS